MDMDKEACKEIKERSGSNGDGKIGCCEHCSIMINNGELRQMKPNFTWLVT